MDYNIDQIKSLEFKEAMRTKVSMYAGSADNQGAFQIFKEILGNSIDEFMNNFGNKINIVFHRDGSISVEDFGRGIPFSKDVKDKTFIDVFTAPHTSGKFDHQAYKNSVGLHGIGLKLAALTSLDFEASSTRHDLIATIKLHKGEVVSYTITKNTTKKKTGTYVRYLLDKDVFNVEKLDTKLNEITNFCRTSSFLNAGLQINIDNKIDNENNTFKSKGIIDLINEDYPNQLIKPIKGFAEDKTDKVEIAYTWHNSASENFFLFVNGMEITNGGQPITGFRTGLTRTINNLIGEKLRGDNIRRGIIYIINIKCLNPSFSDQRKSQINNPNLRGLTDQAISNSLRDFHASDPNGFDKLAQMFTKVEKAEAAAERAREAIMSANKNIKEMSKKKVFAADKLKDARNLGENSILLLVEGDSALGPILEARDASIYGALTLGGKIINAYGHPEEKVLNSEKIQLIFGALGITPGTNKLGKLRYGRAAICTDADSDGAHIALLVMALMQRYCPNFLEEGRLFWLRAPLYSIKKGKKYHYYYNDDEFNKSTIKGEVSRYKGLGSLDNVSVVKESMFGANQRMEKLTWSKEAENLILKFMGEDIEPRKEFVYSKIDFGQEYE